MDRRTTRTNPNQPADETPSNLTLDAIAQVLNQILAERAIPQSPEQSKSTIPTPPIQLPLFTGESQGVDDWHDQFESIAGFAGWNDSKKRISIEPCLGGVARMWMRQRITADQDTWEDFRKDLVRSFRPVDPSLQVRRALQNRRQGHAESV